MTIINDFVMKNLIYSEDTKSFVMRLANEWQKNLPDSRLEFQESAWKIIKDMNKIEEDL